MKQQSTLKPDSPTAGRPRTVIGDQFTPSPEEISALAYEFWIQRLRPIGSPDQDWLRAERELAHRSLPGSVL